jgi:hypothetical protein
MYALHPHREQDKLTALARTVEKEVIFKEDLEKIFGDRPFAPQEQVALTQPQNGNGGKTAPEPGSLGTKEDNTSVA